MKLIIKNWFKIFLAIILLAATYILYLYFTEIPKEKAQVKNFADSVLEKCLIDADNAIHNSASMKADCQGNYFKHLDEGYSQIPF